MSPKVLVHDGRHGHHARSLHGFRYLDRAGYLFDVHVHGLRANDNQSLRAGLCRGNLGSIPRDVRGGAVHAAVLDALYHRLFAGRSERTPGLPVL